MNSTSDLVKYLSSMPKQSILTMETKITSILEGQHYNPTVYFILKVLHSARYLKLLQLLPIVET